MRGPRHARSHENGPRCGPRASARPVRADSDLPDTRERRRRKDERIRERRSGEAVGAGQDRSSFGERRDARRFDGYGPLHCELEQGRYGLRRVSDESDPF